MKRNVEMKEASERFCLVLGHFFLWFTSQGICEPRVWVCVYCWKRFCCRCRCCWRTVFVFCCFTRRGACRLEGFARSNALLSSPFPLSLGLSPVGRHSACLLTFRSLFIVVPFPSICRPLLVAPMCHTCLFFKTLNLILYPLICHAPIPHHICTLQILKSHPLPLLRPSRRHRHGRRDRRRRPLRQHAPRRPLLRPPSPPTLLPPLLTRPQLRRRRRGARVVRGVLRIR